jgi:LmbE family N-acetylglucosaminyl deacetylase
VTAGPGPVLVVSPHLDDAVLSIGATMAALTRMGVRCVLCTVFAGRPSAPLTPAGEAFERHAGVADLVTVRRREDLAAAAILGCEVRHLDLLDAVYRRHDDGRPVYAGPGGAFVAAAEDEPDLVSACAGAVAAVAAEVAATTVLTCSATGGHVDHVVVRLAVQRGAAAPGPKPLFWDELPYAQSSPAFVAPSRSLEPTPSAADVAVKLNAAACYRSQLEMLWPAADWRHSLDRYAARSLALAGRRECLWSGDDLAGQPLREASVSR